jgi:hypothetical protein
VALAAAAAAAAGSSGSAELQIGTPVTGGGSGGRGAATPGAVVVTPGGVTPGDPVPAPQRRGRAPARVAQPNPDSWEGRLVTALQHGAWCTQSYLLETAGMRWWTTAATTLVGLLDLLTQDPLVTIGALLAYVEVHCFATGPPARLVDGLTQCAVLQRLANNVLTVDDVLNVLKLWVLRCLNNKRVTVLQDVESFAEGVMALVTTAQSLQQGLGGQDAGASWQAVCSLAHRCFDDAVQQARNQLVLTTGQHDRDPEDSKSFMLLAVLDMLAFNMVEAAAGAGEAPDGGFGLPFADFADGVMGAGEALPLLTPRCGGGGGGGSGGGGGGGGTLDANRLFVTPLRSSLDLGCLPRTPWSGLSGLQLDFGIGDDPPVGGTGVAPVSSFAPEPLPLAVPAQAAAAADAPQVPQVPQVPHATPLTPRVFVIESLLPVGVLDALRESRVPMFA